LYKVQLHNLEFFAFHGLYEEERIIGNKFIVDLEVTIESFSDFLSIEDAINYVSLFKLIKTKMNHPVDLLETLATQIVEEIRLLDNRISSVNISIKKINPPIKGIRGNVGITIHKKFTN
jgi:dihydroneopterin aldolase